MTEPRSTPTELLARLVDDDGRLLHDINDVPHGVFVVGELRAALSPVTGVAAEIEAERERQRSIEGFSPYHDDEAGQRGELAFAAACYAREAATATLMGRGDNPVPGSAPEDFPWPNAWWKPKGPRRDLVRAAALIIAEIERLDRREGAA